MIKIKNNLLKFSAHAKKVREIRKAEKAQTPKVEKSKKNPTSLADHYRAIQAYSDIASPEFKTNRLNGLSNHAIKNLASVVEEDFNGIRNMKESNKNAILSLSLRAKRVRELRLAKKNNIQAVLTPIPTPIPTPIETFVALETPPISILQVTPTPIPTKEPTPTIQTTSTPQVQATLVSAKEPELTTVSVDVKDPTLTLTVEACAITKKSVANTCKASADAACKKAINNALASNKGLTGAKIVKIAKAYESKLSLCEKIPFYKNISKACGGGAVATLLYGFFINLYNPTVQIVFDRIAVFASPFIASSIFAVAGGGAMFAAIYYENIKLKSYFESEELL